MRPRSTIRPAFLLLSLLALAACGEPTSSVKTSRSVDGDRVGLEVVGAWCRATPNGARTGACYATLTSIGRDDRLASVTTPAADTAQVHEMRTEGDVMRMKEAEGGLPLPEGRRVVLAPGGAHVMLTGLAAPLKTGDRVRLTLEFDRTDALVLDVPVRTKAEG